jgi:hypothetical protein
MLLGARGVVCLMQLGIIIVSSSSCHADHGVFDNDPVAKKNL